LLNARTSEQSIPVQALSSCKQIAREERGENAARVLGFWFPTEITQYENGPSREDVAPSFAMGTPHVPFFYNATTYMSKSITHRRMKSSLPSSLLIHAGRCGPHMVRATGACMQYLDDIIESIT
jgi:hypothetical protein